MTKRSGQREVKRSGELGRKILATEKSHKAEATKAAKQLAGAAKSGAKRTVGVKASAKALSVAAPGAKRLAGVTPNGKRPAGATLEAKRLADATRSAKRLTNGLPKAKQLGAGKPSTKDAADELSGAKATAKRLAEARASAKRLAEARASAKRARELEDAMSSATAPAAVQRRDEDEISAELSRMISELNEVRMRLDAIVRKLATSAMDVAAPLESIDDVEALRMRLLGKLDRMREQLVTRLGEERTIAKDR